MLQIESVKIKTRNTVEALGPKFDKEAPRFERLDMADQMVRLMIEIEGKNKKVSKNTVSRIRCRR